MGNKTLLMLTLGLYRTQFITITLLSTVGSHRNAQGRHYANEVLHGAGCKVIYHIVRRRIWYQNIYHLQQFRHGNRFTELIF